MLELFIGAQCPPCVAADSAFEALAKTYPPADLVLVQYHMHTPGCDPMTIKDVIARWGYYSGRFPGGVVGAPTALFNGAVFPGGGAMDGAESTYRGFRARVNTLLEKATPITLAGREARTRDKVEIAVEHTGVPTGGEGESKLRLLLVEDTVNYDGGNNLQFHHAVVRVMPGGATGTALKDRTGKQAAWWTWRKCGPT